MVKKFFVTKSGVGYERGIYTQKETRKLPKSAHPYIISLAIAIKQGLVDADYSSGEHINELDVYAPVDDETSKQEKIRGVKKGSLKGSLEETKTTTKKRASKKKIDNTLRTKITAAKKKSQEDSIKARIATKKKSNKK